jgi:hypothetical protein
MIIYKDVENHFGYYYATNIKTIVVYFADIKYYNDTKVLSGDFLKHVFDIIYKEYNHD